MGFICGWLGAFRIAWLPGAPSGWLRGRLRRCRKNKWAKSRSLMPTRRGAIAMFDLDYWAAVYMGAALLICWALSEIYNGDRWL